MPAATLRVTGLRAGYGRTVIVEDVAFDVAPGQRLSIIGRNGMGKTTLLATLMGLTTHHAGTIELDGTRLEKASTTRRAGAGFGYVPQTRDIFKTLTVEENLVSGLKGNGKSDIEEAYQLFPRLKERRRNLGWQLSGGEQQMLSTARALLGKPSILLLDEPRARLRGRRAGDGAGTDRVGRTVAGHRRRRVADRQALGRVRSALGARAPRDRGRTSSAAANAAASPRGT